MIDLKEYFDKIYLITSYHSKNRLKTTIPYLNSNNIYPELFVAPLKEHFRYFKCNEIDLWPGCLSLNCAYEQLFQKCLIENTETALFIEDDIEFKDNWAEIIQKKWLNKDSWYMLRDGEYTQFFAMSKEAMRDYLRAFALNVYPVDFALNDLRKSCNAPNYFTTQKSKERKIKSVINLRQESYDLIFE